MRKKSIRRAILIPSLAIIIIGIAILVTVVGVISSNIANDMTGQLMDARVDAQSNAFLLYNDDIYSTLKTTVPIVANYIDPVFLESQEDPRGEIIKILSEVLLSNEKIYGIWTCWEPNAFDGKDSEYANTYFYDSTGRFIPYVYRYGNSYKLESLVDYNDSVKGEYYQVALRTGKPYVTDPFTYFVNGDEYSFMSFAIPIFQNGKAVGVVGVDVNMEDIIALMNTGSILDDGYIFTISPKGLISTHPIPEYVSKHYTNFWIGNYDEDIERLLAKGGLFNIKAYSDVTKNNVALLSSGVEIGDTGRYWLICGVVPEKTVNASSVKLVFTIIAIGLITVLVAGATIFFIVHANLKKLTPVADAAQKISEGNFDVLVGSNKKDEIADVSNALLLVKKNIQKLSSDIKKMSAEFQSGEIEIYINEAEYHGEFQAVVREINSTVSGLIEGTITAIGLVIEFGNGNFDVPVKQYPGKREILTTSFKAVQANLKKFNDDINNIIIVATDGNLDINIDTSKYQGDWNKMASGINGLMAAIIKPIREAISVLNKLSGGNLDATVNGDYKGEFAAMKSALNDTIVMLTSYIKEISTILTALSQNDLNQAVEREYIGEFSAMKTALNKIIDKFNTVIAEIAASADQVAAGSKQIAESSIELSQGATEQASSVEELNATVSVIKDNTSLNAKKAEEAKALSDRSKDNAAKGNSDMDNMLVSMESIKESSNNISKIIQVIDDIASQTNLLSLNAAVEAARAGQHGKSFAVVANEVKNLAGKSKKAAKETAMLIEESINRVNEGTKTASQTAEALRTILNEVSNVAEIVTEIAVSSEEQASAIAQVTDGLSIITGVVQNNSATSEEAASASEELSVQAETLRDLVKVFRLKRK